MELINMLLLTINIHDADTHDAGDDDQGETGSIVVHQQQPVDSSLHTKIKALSREEEGGYILQQGSPNPVLWGSWCRATEI